MFRPPFGKALRSLHDSGPSELVVPDYVFTFVSPDYFVRLLFAQNMDTTVPLDTQAFELRCLGGDKRSYSASWFNNRTLDISFHAPPEPRFDFEFAYYQVVAPLKAADGRAYDPFWFELGVPS